MLSTETNTQPSATLTEIKSQPDVWERTLAELKHSASMERVLQQSHARTEWLFIGCGTSFYLAEAAAASWTMLTKQRARALPASEPLLFPDLTFASAVNLQSVIISRSGSTSEAVRAANMLRQAGVPTLGITCSSDSPLERACDHGLRISVADEESTVMTRSFTAMLLAIQNLAARVSNQPNFIAELEQMAHHFSARVKSICDQAEAFVGEHSFDDYVFLGQGPFYAIGQEGSLKVTEMSCSYSQAFHTLEFRHGPKAIVSKETCLTFFLSGSGYEAECDVLAEMKELGAVTIAICNRADDRVRRSSDLVFELGLAANEAAMLVPSVVPAQLLGFFTGIKKKLNPDHPRNLSRVVMLD
jgi:glucosamine--fructose-6-phosphate aminotransferase (isomerizing)